MTTLGDQITSHVQKVSLYHTSTSKRKPLTEIEMRETAKTTTTLTMDKIEIMAVVVAVVFKTDNEMVVKETPTKDTADQEMVAVDRKDADRMGAVIMAKAVEAMVVAADIIQERSKPHINGKIVPTTNSALVTKETLS